MKKLILLLGVLLALSFVLPDPAELLKPTPTPVTPDVNPAAGTDAKIVKILSEADAADKARVFDVYSSFAVVIKRDGVTQFISTSEQFAKLQERALKIAIDQPGKYEGLDAAIEAVYLSAFGTDDVVAITDEVRTKLITASEIIANSAK